MHRRQHVDEKTVLFEIYDGTERTFALPVLTVWKTKVETSREI
jgi:hypothetical protein